MGRQSLNIARSSVSSANHLRLFMEDKPTESETIIEPEPDPVAEFKKGKAKRESKRKEVKVITEYVPEAPVSTESVAAAVEVPDAESIAGRVADLLFAKMAVEKDEVTPDKVKTTTRPRAPTKKKEVEAPLPPTKYFGWC